MFFKKFFDKNLKYYLDKGDKYLEEERYADARHSYLEALQKLDDCEGPANAELRVREGLAETGLKLALLNLSEAAHAIGLDDAAKASDHIQLALEFSEDEKIREKAAALQKELGQPRTQPENVRPGHACAGCSTGSGTVAADHDMHDDGLAAEDRLALLIQTLPEELAGRYATMGERFSSAYLAAHEGNEPHALNLYQELLQNDENDILLYEMAIIYFRNGRFDECDRLLRRAIDINPRNELCYLGLVQLMTDTGRAPESLPLVKHMIAEGIMAGQATIILGDVYLLMGEEAKAMDTLLPALESSATAKAAAERLIPLLEGQNRREEAAYLFKKHLKGCC